MKICKYWLHKSHYCRPPLEFFIKTLIMFSIKMQILFCIVKIIYTFTASPHPPHRWLRTNTNTGQIGVEQTGIQKVFLSQSNCKSPEQTKALARPAEALKVQYL